MNTTLKRSSIATDGPFLFSLVDALNCSGALNPDDARQFAEVRGRLEKSQAYDVEAENLFEMLERAENTGVMAGTWIEARWKTVLSRVAENRT